MNPRVIAELNARTEEVADVMARLTEALDQARWTDVESLGARFEEKTDAVLEAQRDVLFSH